MKDGFSPPQIDLRPPGTVMRLERMGAMFPTRLSFLRSLIRDLARDNAKVTRPCWEIDAAGIGHAVYSVRFRGRTYSLVAVANDLPDSERSDRVIATAWDAAFVLYDGVPNKAELARICATAPLQEAARFCERDLVLSRANKSVRVFSEAVSALQAGQRQGCDALRRVGYLMRTTAVYGNGKFGIADRSLYSDRPGMSGAFRAEMLTVYLIRQFTLDLLEHLAGVRMEPNAKRQVGVGNATGLGMAPFLVNHPVLLNNWMVARETALARVCAAGVLSEGQSVELENLHAKAVSHLEDWHLPDEKEAARVTRLRAEWAGLKDRFQPNGWCNDRPLARLIHESRSLSLDAQELLVSLVLEPFGGLVDELAEGMTDPFGPPHFDLAQTDEVAERIDKDFRWALEIDFQAPAARERFWYVSACKQEPRLGNRYEEPGAELESPLDIAFRINNLRADLPSVSGSLVRFLSDYPEHLLAVRRVALAAHFPYGEIRDNLTAHTMRPVDMLRCKLAFFGASHFDPLSDLWTRITLFRGAPLTDELGPGADAPWLPTAAS